MTPPVETQQTGPRAVRHRRAEQRQSAEHQKLGMRRLPGVSKLHQTVRRELKIRTPTKGDREAATWNLQEEFVDDLLVLVKFDFKVR
jgi:hypothetical protein